MNTSESFQPKKIVIFASGTGTNAENIIRYFKADGRASVVYVLANKKYAKVLKKAYDLGVRALYFDKKALYHSNEVLNVLRDIQPDLIVLAGFLWIFPEKIVKEFPQKIINIHPALLPKYGGKGMYGDRVHKAIAENKEVKSGITIHYVNEKYDEGKIIAQFETALTETDTPKEIAEKIHALEQAHFPKVIESVLFPESETSK